MYIFYHDFLFSIYQLNLSRSSTDDSSAYISKYVRISLHSAQEKHVSECIHVEFEINTKACSYSYSDDVCLKLKCAYIFNCWQRQCMLTWLLEYRNYVWVKIHVLRDICLRCEKLTTSSCEYKFSLDFPLENVARKCIYSVDRSKKVSHSKDYLHLFSHFCYYFQIFYRNTYAFRRENNF